ncbi:Hypothetical predicted protein [Marmota monax]|uniref:Olduvai domain-containing protein n=1 Tax=Marmota monax TaxID=9995 RepID=A0A5E4D7T7_MARMO|nr:hypothetical protein GHT09_010227 [Marmota monax]VTJ90225.1 Hypothetical predicted protein [Marmota monax]
MVLGCLDLISCPMYPTRFSREVPEEEANEVLEDSLDEQYLTPSSHCDCQQPSSSNVILSNMQEATSAMGRARQQNLQTATPWRIGEVESLCGHDPDLGVGGPEIPGTAERPPPALPRLLQRPRPADARGPLPAPGPRAPGGSGAPPACSARPPTAVPGLALPALSSAAVGGVRRQSGAGKGKGGQKQGRLDGSGTFSVPEPQRIGEILRMQESVRTESGKPTADTGVDQESSKDEDDDDDDFDDDDGSSHLKRK